MNSKIFLTGFMGSGKTFWGKIWAKEYDLDFFDLDQEVEKAAGEPIPRIFEASGEAYFRQMERDVLRAFAFKNDFILACGGGTPCYFQNVQWMNGQGITIYLQASVNEIINRIQHETQVRPLLHNIGAKELPFYIDLKLKEREPFYKQAKHILKVGGLSANSLANVIL